MAAEEAFPIAFHLETHVPGPRASDTDAAIVDQCVSYGRQHSNQLRWYVDDRRGRFKEFSDDDLDTIEGFRADSPDAPPRYWMAHGGATKDTPSDWSLFGRLKGLPSSSFQLRWPLDLFEGRWGEAAAEIRERLKGRPLLQGRAGFVFAEVNGQERNKKLRQALAGRFLGVDVGEVSSSGLDAADGLGSVNWLTAIGNDFVEKLGGRRAFSSLGNSILVHELGTGVLVQAGESPSLGDINAGDALSAYREVAKFVMPVRYRGHVSWTNVMPADAKAWVGRLDP